MLSYIKGYTQPEISMSVHQCAQFCNNPRFVHKHDIRHIAKFLSSTSTYVDLTDRNRQLFTRGVVYSPNKEKGIECYVDANFYGGWSQADADNAENLMSHAGYVITYILCPVLWCNK